MGTRGWVSEGLGYTQYPQGSGDSPQPPPDFPQDGSMGWSPPMACPPMPKQGALTCML